MPQKYPQSFRDRAVRMVLDRLNDDKAVSPLAVIKEVAPRLGVANETLRRWVNQDQVDAGKRPGVSTEESAEIRKLRRENSELRRANGLSAPRLSSQRNQAALRRNDRLR
ncbi:transposase [Actinomycetaceae bacterium MB13-C1-2]|nr:transposase [Actinomycetaceae bacterium MB13-C1-2]